MTAIQCQVYSTVSEVSLRCGGLLHFSYMDEKGWRKETEWKGGMGRLKYPVDVGLLRVLLVPTLLVAMRWHECRLNVV